MIKSIPKVQPILIGHIVLDVKTQKPGIVEAIERNTKGDVFILRMLNDKTIRTREVKKL